MRPRILFVVPHLYGSMRLLATTLRHMRRDRYAITLLVLGHNTVLGDEFPEDVDIRVLGGADTLRDRIAALWAIICAGRKHDLIIAYAELTPTYLTALGGWLTGRPVVGWVHTHLSEIFRHRLRPEGAHRAIVRAIYPRLHSVVGVGRTVARDLARAFGLQNARCIPNCLDLAEVRRLANETPPAEAIGLADKPMLVAVGVMGVVKGFETLIAAHARVRAAGIGHTLVIIGDGPLANDLAALAERLGVVDSVRFPGFLKNPYPVMARAHGLVVSSRLEGFCLVAAEALALGIPVIATRVAGPDEILDDGRYGPLVPVGDVAAMAAAMERLLTDDAWRTELARNAPEAARRYDARTIVPQVEALFDEALTGGAGRRMEGPTG